MTPKRLKYLDNKMHVSPSGRLRESAPQSALTPLERLEYADWLEENNYLHSAKAFREYKDKPSVNKARGK